MSRLALATLIGSVALVVLLQFSYRSDGDGTLATGYGMVGSMTWSSLEVYDVPPTPEAPYTHHCALELSRAGGEAEGTDQAEALARLRESNPGMFPQPE